MRSSTSRSGCRVPERVPCFPSPRGGESGSRGVPGGEDPAAATADSFNCRSVLFAGDAIWIVQQRCRADSLLREAAFCRKAGMREQKRGARDRIKGAAENFSDTPGLKRIHCFIEGEEKESALFSGELVSTASLPSFAGHFKALSTTPLSSQLPDRGLPLRRFR